jgi:predicted DNA binding CopG/RHH family protein
VQVPGETERKSMKNKIKHTNEPMDHVKIVSDFLPPPEQLVFKEETVKVTIALSKSSVDYFKKLAVRFHTPYQKMIRKLLDEYVRRQAES